MSRLIDLDEAIKALGVGEHCSACPSNRCAGKTIPVIDVCDVLNSLPIKIIDEVESDTTGT